MSLSERLTRLEATLPPMGPADDGARLRLATRLDALAARVQARPAPLEQQHQPSAWCCMRSTSLTASETRGSGNQ